METEYKTRVHIPAGPVLRPESQISYALRRSYCTFVLCWLYLVDLSICKCLYNMAWQQIVHLPLSPNYAWSHFVCC